MSYFHGKYIPLSSAQRRFTVLFGMGRGGTNSLWSSGMRGCCADLWSAQPIWGRSSRVHSWWSASLLPVLLWVVFVTTYIRHNTDLNLVCELPPPFGGGVQVSAQALTLTDTKHTGYRIKPYGQLVSVSLMHYCTSTPDLSTSWSRTTLQGARSSRDISSQGEFPA